MRCQQRRRLLNPILEEDDALGGGLQRQLAMRGGVEHALAGVFRYGYDGAVIEEPRGEFEGEDMADGTVDVVHGDQASGEGGGELWRKGGWGGRGGGGGGGGRREEKEGGEGGREL